MCIRYNGAELINIWYNIDVILFNLRKPKEINRTKKMFLFWFVKFSGRFEARASRVGVCGGAHLGRQDRGRWVRHRPLAKAHDQVGQAGIGMTTGLPSYQLLCLNLPFPIQTILGHPCWKAEDSWLWLLVWQWKVTIFFRAKFCYENYNNCYSDPIHTREIFGRYPMT